MHVAGLGIYDPSTAPGGKVRFKQILDFFSRRLDSAKIFRRRLVGAPLGLDRPYWIDEGEIDTEYHVRHIALPQPGDWRQLMIQVARIHSRPLDRSRPLWEVYVIEGLDNIPGVAKGSFALYVKFHHAGVDGEGGAEILKAIHTLSADFAEETASGERTVFADSIPAQVELYSRAVGNRARQAFDAARLAVELGGRAALAGKDLVASGKALETARSLIAKHFGGGRGGRGEKAPGDMAGRKPETRFDRPVSPHRVVDAVGFSLAECKTIREHVDGITINDIFMAATGGGIRKYLERKGELPARTLNAMVPMSTRGGNKEMDSGNQIGMAPMALRTDLADPVERVLAIRRGTTRTKAATSALGKDLLARLVDVIPAVAAEQLVRVGLVAMCNVTVSNVRGPDVPLYMAGAQLELFLGVSIAFDGIGLNVTGFSYHGTLWVCFVACRKMVPDPADLCDCLRESFAELLAGAIARDPKHARAPRRRVGESRQALPQPARTRRLRRPGWRLRRGGRAPGERHPWPRSEAAVTGIRRDLHGKWALVTGASSGLGIDFAHLLAARGANLVLVARRGEPMRELAAELKRTHGAHCHVIAMDLARRGVGAELHAKVKARRVAVDILINNAGYGVFGDFVDQDVDREIDMLQLNVIALTELTHAFAADMARRGAGRILLVGSLGGFQPLPMYAAYAASKAYVLSFGEALHEELKDRGVTVTVLCPGVTATNFLAVSGQGSMPLPDVLTMESRPVAEIGLKALDAGQASVVPGLPNRATAFANRILPRSLFPWLAYWILRR
jgi:WS/DGAT/MGAT family acyltransferase